MPKFSGKIFMGGLKVKISYCMVSRVQYKDYVIHTVVLCVFVMDWNIICVCVHLNVILTADRRLCKMFVPCMSVMCLRSYFNTIGVRLYFIL